MQDQPTTAPQSKLGTPFSGLSLLICLATALTLLATWWWPFELLTHFRVQYVWLLAILSVILVVRKHYRVAIVAAICLVWNAVLVVPVYFGATAEGGSELRLMSANVLTSNREYRLLLETVRQIDPDVLVAMEIDDQWQKALEELRDEYPHGKFVSRQDNFGIALLSKLPLESCEELELGDSNLPSLAATLNLGGNTLVIVGTHPPPPVGDRAAMRNSQLSALAQYTAPIDGPLIIAGDLNLTPWSPYFTRLLSEGKVLDSRAGFGVHATWPAGWGWAGIPIDHVLVSEQFGVVDRWVGPDVGSDHRPVIVDLRIGRE